MDLSDYNIASWIISKALALTYMIAFLSLMPQLLGLYGRRGILSIDHLLNILDKEMKFERFYHVPSLFWFASSDRSLRFFCLLGLTAATLALLGFSQTWMFLLCWIIYLSFVSCGQIFLSYQWDSLLLELGFLGLFFAPFNFEWLTDSFHVLPPLVLALTWFLLFKLMFLSGLVKLTHKDVSWKNLTALSYHYWTQPLPGPLAYWMAKLPLNFHKFSTVVMFIVELGLPFLILFPETRAAACAGLIFLQVLIILTGNYAFFNIITILMSLALLSDRIWHQIFGTLHIPGWNLTPLQNIDDVASFIAVLILVPPSLFWIFKTFKEKSKVLDFFLPVMRFLYPFRISNPYGLFAIMTKSRPELVIEGSNDGEHWKAYEFRNKPGAPERALPLVAPHQPRFDWQMWFAALENFNDNLWLQNVIVRLFENSPDVKTLFASCPFAEPPKYLRIQRYDYHFSTFSELKEKGLWWTRHLIGPYSQIFEISDFQGDRN
ncbi:hypothetical protein D3C87_253300 [compost metagenome]